MGLGHLGWEFRDPAFLEFGSKKEVWVSNGHILYPHGEGLTRRVQQGSSHGGLHGKGLKTGASGASLERSEGGF